MTERGHRTSIAFGGVTAEVSLLKMSGKPKEAQHDVRWPDEPEEKKARATSADVPDSLKQRGPADDPFAAAVEAPPADELADLVEAADPPDAREPMHGVELDSGEFVDLTERLEAIDGATVLPNMEVIACVPSASVPRTRVRDAHWVASGDPRSAKVLRLLREALGAAGRVAVVRWTKRTNQALGVLVPRSRPTALALLELEWADNMRPPSERVTGPMGAEITDGELSAAARLVGAYAAGPEALDELRDERLAKRAELLQAAREGRLDGYEPPSPPEPADAIEDVVARWAAAAEGART